jgi:hypothetical protein
MSELSPIILPFIILTHPSSNNYFSPNYFATIRHHSDIKDSANSSRTRSMSELI